MKSKKIKFNSLHNHSSYSTLDACVGIDKAIESFKDRGIKSFALTDHGTLSGNYELWDKCNEADIKPILGIEAYYVDDLNKDESTVAYCYAHIVILCKNETGWNNLKEMQSLAWKNGFLGRPRIDFNMLKKYHKGLIVSTACTGGLIGQVMFDEKYYVALSAKKRNKIINKRIKKFSELFGDNFYLEIMLNDMKEQAVLNKKIIKLSKKYEIDIIVTNDTHYIDKEDCDLHDIVRCTAFKKTLQDENNGTYDIRELYFATYKSLQKFRKKYHKYILEADLKRYVQNSNKIEDKIKKYPICTSDSALPVFTKNSKGMLKKLCRTGIRKLFDGDKQFNKVYKSRLAYELKVINTLGMADYFLIVWDIAHEARRRNIPFNTRGSVAGSLVAFLVGISWIDPIRFNTTFERFLTADRISLPDIDMDFGKQRREELIDYLREKYGEQNVAHIVNFTIYKPKSAIKDVARVHGLSFQLVNKLTKLIPDSVEEWEEIANIAELNEFFEENQEIAEYAEQLIGLSRSRGVHASGVVLTPGNSIRWTPVAWSTTGKDSKRERITEFDMYALEDLNILKLDFLGQNTLDIIQHTLNIIDGKMKTFDELYAVILNDLDNKKVYENICQGNLVGMFQMGTSEGMRELVVEMVPTCIEDIVACIALYRTAILSVGAHKRYVARRFGEEEVDYIHPKMKKVLSVTYGIILYQEQVSSLAVHLAGFTKTESDHFRKGIKLKDVEKFNVWEEKFIKGCKKYSKIDEDTAQEIWDEIVEWSGYGFNLGHSTSYAVIAYITAWLKTFYPSEFMTALLSHNTDEDDKLNIYIKEIKKMGLKLVSPSIINSENDFIYKNGKVLYPLSVIKNVGDKAIQNILKVRSEKNFKSFEDFYKRVEKRTVNVRVINNLIFANAFRKFGKMNDIYNAFYKLRPKDKSIRTIYCKSCRYKYPVSMTLAQVKNEGVACPECGSVKVNYQHDSIKKKQFNLKYCKSIIYGFTMDSPLKPYLGDFINYNAIQMKDAVEKYDGESVVIGGIITKIKKWIDKNDNEMAFIQLSDGEEFYDMVVFASLWEEYSDIVKKNVVYVFSVKVDDGGFLLTKGGLEKLVTRR